MNNNEENQLNNLKNCYSENEKNKTNSNQTNCNDSNNYKKYFNKTTSSQLITTSNSVIFNSFENNPKKSNKPNNKNLFLQVENEINIDIHSIKMNDNSLTNKTEIHFNDSKIDQLNLINKKSHHNVKRQSEDFFIVDQPINIQLLNKKRNHNVQLDRNDFSKIKNDLCPDNNYQGYRMIHHQNTPQFSEGFLSNFDFRCYNKLSNDEIIDDLKFYLLKHNLEKKKSEINSNVEKMISKEIFFHQLFSLYTSKENTRIKSFIIKRINGLIMEDNIDESLFLLSKIQILKDSSFNKKQLKQKSLLKLLEMISNNNYMHKNLNDCK